METSSQKINYEPAVELLSILANGHRLTILSLITRSEIRVGELAALTGLSQSAISQHLAMMRSSSLVTTRREAQTIYYSCSSVAIKTLLDALGTLFPFSSIELPDTIARSGRAEYLAPV